MSQGAPEKDRWFIVFLLFLFMLVNFADRIVVGLAGVPIMRDLNLSPKQFGLLGSSFFFLYALSAIVVGFVANRVETRWLLLTMGIIWSLAQFPMAAPAGFTTLLVCRIILGAGEGPASPVAVHAAYKLFPDAQRTLPTAILAQGSAFGVILAVPALNWVIVNYSWHWAFAVLGIVGLLWSLLWLAFGREGTIEEQKNSRAAAGAVEYVSYYHLLLSWTFIGACLALFSTYWALSLGLTWFTPFLRQGLGYSQIEAGNISVLPWIAGASVVLLSGWIGQVALTKGVSSRAARGLFSGIAMVIGGLITIAMTQLSLSTTATIALLVIGSSLPAVIYVMVPAILAEFTPVGQRGAVLAINTAVSTTSGLIAPYVMGSLLGDVPTRDGYMIGFLVCGMVQVAGGLAALISLRPASEQARIVRLATRRVPEVIRAPAE
jgi:MFS family permease